MKKYVLVFSLLLIGVLLTACSKYSNNSPTSTVDSPTKSSTGEVKRIDVVAKQWEFVPKSIKANVGDTVEIHLTTADVTHGFLLPEFAVDERIEPGKETVVKFVASKKGKFAFACNVPCGAGHQMMQGDITVE